MPRMHRREEEEEEDEEEEEEQDDDAGERHPESKTPGGSPRRPVGASPAAVTTTTPATTTTAAVVGGVAVANNANTATPHITLTATPSSENLAETISKNKQRQSQNTAQWLAKVKRNFGRLQSACFVWFVPVRLAAP